jgi:hypothetical protein
LNWRMVGIFTNDLFSGGIGRSHAIILQLTKTKWLRKARDCRSIPRGTGASPVHFYSSTGEAPVPQSRRHVPSEARAVCRAGFDRNRSS